MAEWLSSIHRAKRHLWMDLVKACVDFCHLRHMDDANAESVSLGRHSQASSERCLEDLLRRSGEHRAGSTLQEPARGLVRQSRSESDWYIDGDDAGVSEFLELC